LIQNNIAFYAIPATQQQGNTLTIIQKYSNFEY
jgi:hypothetical protein